MTITETLLDDHRLVARAAAAIGVPRAEIRPGTESFVLHAPLELMARAALLPYVADEARPLARRRIELLATAYDDSGPSVPPAPDRRWDSLSDAAAWLTAAISAGDLDEIDGAACFLGDRASSHDVTRLLAGHAVDSLAAAGHANIFFALLSRTQPRGLPHQMLRHPARALGHTTGTRLAVPQARLGGGGRDLLAALGKVEVIGPPPLSFIAPMVDHAQTRGAFDVLLDDDGGFTAPAATPYVLQRFAAHAMLQGPPDQAPYGWTHHLTLAQAPLLLADLGVERARATFVAVAYLAAHWAELGIPGVTVDVDYRPDPVSTPLSAALGQDPSEAAAAAWYAADLSEAASQLATSAAQAHDAHRVKYTLACLDAASTDPDASRLYLAAAAYLNAWWIQRGDPSDPLSLPTGDAWSGVS